MSVLRNIALNARIVCGATLLAVGALIMPQDDLKALLRSYSKQLENKEAGRG